METNLEDIRVIQLRSDDGAGQSDRSRGEKRLWTEDMIDRARVSKNYNTVWAVSGFTNQMNGCPSFEMRKTRGSCERKRKQQCMLDC